MDITPKNINRRYAAGIAAAAVLGVVGVGGVTAANAATHHAPSHSQVQKSDGDGEQNPATEAKASDGDGEQNPATEAAAQRTDKADKGSETNDDATDHGPDANPNEPGHQDASDATGQTD